MSDKAILSDIAVPRQAGRIPRHKRDKAPPTIHHAHVICAELDLSPTALQTFWTAFVRRPRRGASQAESGENPRDHAFPPPAPIPAWARASGRAGEGDPLFVAAPARASRCFLRRDPPAAGALRWRLAFISAAASGKILRLNADERALRDLRFAVGEELGSAANLLTLWRELAAGRPRSTAAGSSPRRGCSTLLCWTRTASHPA